MRRVVGFVGLVALAACSHAPETTERAVEATAPIDVETVKAEPADRPTVTSWLGSIVADEASRLAANAGGLVVAVRVDRGEAVAKGQVLAEVDPLPARLQAEAGAAQAALAAAQQTALDADCARFRALFDEGVISAAQLERAVAQCAAQGKAVEAAAAQAEIARVSSTRTLVRAPFAGVVEERLVHEGEYVGPASPVVSLVATDPVRVRFSVAERDLARVKAGAGVEVRAASAPDVTLTGVVLPLPPTGRSQSRDVEVEVRVANPDGVLRPGLSASVALASGSEPVVVVPADTVVNDDTVHRLFVVREGRAVETVVHVERLADGRLAVSPGIAAGDEVVLHPTVALRDGAQVQ